MLNLAWGAFLIALASGGIVFAVLRTDLDEYDCEISEDELDGELSEYVSGQNVRTKK